MRLLAGYRLVRNLVAVAVLLGLVWLVSALGIGLQTVVPLAIDRALPAGWHARVGSVEGSWLSTIRIDNLRLTGPHISAAVSHLRVDYSLGGLLRREIRLRRVALGALKVEVDRVTDERGSDSSPEPGRPPALPDLSSWSPLGAWSLRVDTLRVEEARLSHGRGSDLRAIRNGELEASLTLAPSHHDLVVDALHADVVTPVRPDATAARTATGRLDLTGSLRDGVLRIGELNVESRGTRLHASGAMPLAAAPADSVASSLSIDARPLDLRGLPFEPPALAARWPLLTLHASVSDHGADAVELSATARATSGTEPGAVDRGRVALDLDAVLARDSLTAPRHVRATLVRRPARDRAQGLLSLPLRADIALTRTDSTSLHGRGPAYRTRTTFLADRAHAALSRWDTLGVVEADVRGPAASWNVDFRLDSASLHGAGTLALSEPPELDVTELVVASLDLHRISSELPSTSLSGRVRAHVAGPSLDSVAGSAALAMDASSLQGAALDTLAVHTELSPGQAGGELVAGRGRTRVTSTFRLRLEDSAVLVEADPVTLAIEATDTSDGAGSAVRAAGRARGRWRLGGSGREAALSLDLDSATASGVRARGASIRARLDGDDLSADVHLEALPTSVAGSVRVHGTLASSSLDPERAEVEMHVVATRSRPEGGGADSLSAAVSSMRACAGFDLDATLWPAEGGRLRLDGRLEETAEGWSLASTARGRLERSALFRGTGADTLEVDVSARRVGDEWERLGGELWARGVAWRRLAADTVVLGFSANASEMRLDTLALVANVARLHGSGSLSATRQTADTIVLSGELLSLGPLLGDVEAERTTGTSDLRATLTGTVDSIEARASATLRSLSYRAVTAGGLDLEGTASLERSGGAWSLGPENELDAHVDQLVLPDSEIRAVDVAARGGPDSLRVEAAADVDDLRRGDLTVVVDPRPGRQTVRIERLDLRLDQDRWGLAGPATLAYGDGYSLRAFRLEAGEQAIEIDGSVVPDGPLDVTMVLDSTDIGTVTDLAGFPQLNGWLGGRLRLEGTTAAPDGQAYLRGAFHRQGQAPARARASLHSDGDRVSGDIDLVGASGGHLRLDGSVGLDDDAPRDRLDIRVLSEDVGLAALLPFFGARQVSTLSGGLDADASVRGSPGSPTVDGSLRVHDASIGLPRLGVTWRDVELHAHGQGSDLVVDSSRLASGGGTATLGGSVSLAEGHALDIGIDLHDFRAIRTDAYRAVVSGRLDTDGDLRNPILEGDLRVQSLDVFLDQRVASRSIADVELTEEDLRMLRERFGYVPESTLASRPFTDRLSADLTVALGRDSWLRKRSSPELAAAFTGEVDVRLRPGEEPSLQGSVTTIEGRGYVEEFGRRFELREGTVTMDGPPSDARLDLSATYVVPSRDDPGAAEATIVLAITGTQEELSLELSSEPPMENADIVSYIATGKPAGESLAFEESDSQGGLVAAGADLALGRLTGIVESAATRSVGLDVVEIRREGLREATLVAGKYLSPRLYVGFAQPVTLREGDGLSLGSEGESEVEVEIEALRWLLLNVEGSGSALRLFLKGRYAY